MRDLREQLDTTDVDAEVELHRIESDEEARQRRFLGSPSVRVEGQDVEPGAGARQDYGMKCRLYRTPQGLERVPPRDWIRAALGLADRPGERDRGDETA